MAVKKFGIVGPADQVAIASTVAASYTGLQPIRLAYGHERETLALIGPQADQVDGWLFTGVVPYELARTAGALQHPARYVSYGRVGFLSSLIRLSLAGVDLSRLSIDTLSELEVRETLADTGLDLDRVSVLPYRAGVTSVEMVDLHRQPVQGAVPHRAGRTTPGGAHGLRTGRHRRGGRVEGIQGPEPFEDARSGLGGRPAPRRERPRS